MGALKFAAVAAGLLASAALMAGPQPANAASDRPAKELFSRMQVPAGMPPDAVGSYAKGCLAGAVALPTDGEHYQAMRLSRNRNWGHPAMLAFLRRLSAAVVGETDWPGLLVGDVSQPRGGPMPGGHVSHQIGLDADVWLMPSPPRRYTAQERENTSAVSVLLADKSAVDPTIWSAAHVSFLRLAASDPAVARIFANPAIKRALCQSAGADRAWLRKIRPWYSHYQHVHIRLACPEGDGECVDQAPPPPGDGCGKELDWWFTDEPYKAPDTPRRPRPQLTMADLPRTCGAVLGAQ